jgi:hypothetical protein
MSRHEPLLVLEAMNTETPLFKFIKIFLGAALVVSLVGAGWNVYRRLPADGAWARTEVPVANSTNANSVVTIVLRSESAATQANTRIELYPIDFAATQRDFSAVLRPGKSFDDFLTQRIKGLVPVRAQADDNGRAVARLSEGNWWIRATAALTNGEKIEWRLPIIVSGRAQTIELTAENAYERTKTF